MLLILLCASVLRLLFVFSVTQFPCYRISVARIYLKMIRQISGSKLIQMTKMLNQPNVSQLYSLAQKKMKAHPMK